MPKAPARRWPAARLFARERVNGVRRRVQMRVDQAWALVGARLARPVAPQPFDGSPRFAVVTVNFSTTRYLKLMLLTLSEQRDLDLLHRIVVVDNGLATAGKCSFGLSRPGSHASSWSSTGSFLNHPRGMRAGRPGTRPG